MHVNTHLVRSLMALKGVTAQVLALSAGVREKNLLAWLSDLDDSELFLLERSQIDVLRALGIDIDEECPRGDTVHVWRVREPVLGSPSRTYAGIAAVCAAFGKAELVHFARERDPMLTFEGRTLFGLKFEKFCAVLVVETPLFAGVNLERANVEGLTWGAGSPVRTLTPDLYARMAHGDVTVGEFEGARKGKLDPWKWERLSLIARERGVTSEEVELWITQQNPAGASIALPGKSPLRLTRQDGETAAGSSGLFRERRVA